jgi:ribosomal protein S27AE
MTRHNYDRQVHRVERPYYRCRVCGAGSIETGAYAVRTDDASTTQPRWAYVCPRCADAIADHLNQQGRLQDA